MSLARGNRFTIVVLCLTSTSAAFSPLLSSAGASFKNLPSTATHAPIHRSFVPELQAAATTPTAADPFVNVTSHLGANNPSIQFDGVNFHYHFSRGDAGWISAFETANRLHIHRIYFPRGVY